VVLSSPLGHALRATLWTVDVDRRRLAFEVESTDPALQGLVGGNECTVVAYLQRVKLQFDLDHLMLVRGPQGTALQAQLPERIYRFQRRLAFRVPTLKKPAPTADLRHPGIPDMRLRLRILDVSAGGCALQLPPDVPPLPMGIVLDGVQLNLDAGTRLKVRLRMQHASSMGPQAEGVRLGCELLEPTADTLRGLQRYVDQLQRRRRLMALD
jgi:c-di-GMP-binding flagellar brake protein YcgR